MSRSNSELMPLLYWLFGTTFVVSFATSHGMPSGAVLWCYRDDALPRRLVQRCMAHGHG